MTTMAKPPLLAVLIDADNISAKHAELMFEEIASLGEASIRRIYGDFAGGGPQGWSKEKLANLAIVPHQQFANTTGKNASDIALVIDAMDILHSGRFDGFVLISSDSDFTRPHPRTGGGCLWHGHAQNPGGLCKSLQTLHLCGKSDPRGQPAEIQGKTA